jgi:hypothetical protein
MFHQVRRTAFVGRPLAVAVMITVCAAFALGQVTSGTMFGTVKDPTGAIVSGATVKVLNPSNGLTRVVHSTESGDFVVPNLLPGTYNISVEAQGFKKVQKTGVVLSAADRLNAGDFMLTVGATTDSVTVIADAGQLQVQTNSGERSDLITSKQLNDVALNGRNVLDYMKLIPGASGVYDGHESGTGGIDAFNINGTRSNQHEYTIDGASNVDTGNNGGTHVTINPDAIEEVRVLTSNYQAEYGKAAGGQIALTTKSGTNTWHGNARFFHRNESLNANEWFNKKNQLGLLQNEIANNQPIDVKNTPGLYRYNDIGYQFGGPLKKDKLFVFWSQEFYRQFVPIGGTTTFYTPTALERQGDFSQSVDGTGTAIVVYNPATGQPFPNNQIDPTQLPAARQAVFAQISKLLSLYPLPNVPGFGSNGLDYNYSTTLSYDHPRREDILRMDYQLNSQNRLYGRWTHNSDHLVAPFSPGGLGAVDCLAAINFPGGCIQDHPGWNASLNLVSTIRPNLLNEFSIGPSVTKSLVTGSNGNISLAKNGITLPLLYPSETIPDMGFGGLNHVNFGWSYLGSMPWHQANTTINVNDNVSWVRGAHTVKAGLFYQRNRKDQIAWGNVNGQFSFDNAATGTSSCPSDAFCGDPYASALLGDFKSFDQSTARPVGMFRYNQLEFYVQDTWKILPRLTLDYGMRFAWIPPQYDARNQIALFDPAAYNPANAVQIDSGGNVVPGSGDPLNGIRYTKNGTLPTGGWDSHGIMPEPRFGFAYDMFGTHKTVLRGGAGMMHDRVQGNLIFNPVFNNPAIVQTAIVSSNNIANLPSLGGNFGTGVLGGIVGARRSGNVPTVYSFSFGIQHELAKETTLDLAYVGTLSRHLVTSRDINAIPYGTAFTAAAQDPANYTGYCSSPAPGNPCTNGIPAVEPGLNPIYSAAGLNFSGINAYGRQGYTDAPLVPFKGYGQISYMNFDGTANYNSLQASLQRRFAKGLTFGAVYTWSKSLTTANSDQDTQDAFFVRSLDYRTASWDRTHVFAANYVYDIPGLAKHFGAPKWLSYLTDNYQLSGITNFMTGTPVDLNNGWNFEHGAITGSNMWGAIPYYYTFDPSGNLVQPQVGVPLRGSRDMFRTGGMQNWDMSLFKNIPLSERYSIQLRLEAFNVFNHPNFNNRDYGVNINNFPNEWSPSDPIGLLKSKTWGQPTDTYGGVGGFRVVQLAAKFYF